MGDEVHKRLIMLLTQINLCTAM